MMLIILELMRRDYGGKKHIGAVFKELHIRMAIAAGGPGLTVYGLARQLGVPRQNINRAVEALMRRQGIRKKMGRVNSDALPALAMQMRIGAKYLRAIEKAIITAADELKKR
jgi:hypothetical protein